MKLRLLCLVLLATSSLYSCNEIPSNKKQNSYTRDSLPAKQTEVIYDDRRESLKLSIPDTLTRYKAYFFSNIQTKDTLILKISPGLIKYSKAELRIVTSAGTVIYTQTFDAFYFIRGIYESDTTTIPDGQDSYEAQMEKYWKSITAKQYEDYFRKSIDSFYTNIYMLESTKPETFNAAKDEIVDNDFLNEIITDSTIKLVDITCFDCYEGGTVIGFSRKKNKVSILLEHD